MKKLTYFTPSYNRGYILGNLYESLKRQTDKSFIWLIVDDGSKDNTDNLVEKWIKENIIEIQYLKKDNGGKHTTIDFANQHCTTEYIACVDSDDILTDDTTEILNSNFDKVSSMQDIAGIMAKKRAFDAEDENIPNEEIVSFYDEQEKLSKNKEVFLIFKTDIAKAYHFPEIKDEKFITESVYYQQFLYDYKLYSINKTLYLFEYIEDGYTKQGMDLFFKNPKGYLFALKQNLFYNIKNKKSFISNLHIAISFYTWKKALNLSDDFKDVYKLKFPYNFLGNLISIKNVKKLKKQYKEYLNRIK